MQIVRGNPEVDRCSPRLWLVDGTTHAQIHGDGGLIRRCADAHGFEPRRELVDLDFGVYGIQGEFVRI